MFWIRIVEIAKSIDALMTSRSITEQRDFPDYDMLDAMIASALTKLLNTQTHFRKRVSVKEQRAHKHDRFFRGRQIAFMIHEYFRATRACEAVQGLSPLFAFSLQNDDVQEFDVRRDHALLSVSNMLSVMILEGLYKSKLQNSVQLQTVLALYDQETARSQEPNFQQLKTAVKLHTDQMMRSRNFRVRNDVVERGSVEKRKKRKNTSSFQKLSLSMFSENSKLKPTQRNPKLLEQERKRKTEKKQRNKSQEKKRKTTSENQKYKNETTENKIKRTIFKKKKKGRKANRQTKKKRKKNKQSFVSLKKKFKKSSKSSQRTVPELLAGHLLSFQFFQFFEFLVFFLSFLHMFDEISCSTMRTTWVWVVDVFEDSLAGERIEQLVRF